MGLWIRCGNENAVFTMCWKKFAETEKSLRARLIVKVTLTDFFEHLGYCAPWILTSAVNSESVVLSRNAEKFKRKCQEKNTSVAEKQHLVSPSWQCAWSRIDNTRTVIHDFWPTRTQLCFLSHPTHLTCLRQTSPYFPNWSPFWKDDDFRRFKTLLKIRRRG
jgi:hypothetical protein